MEPILILVIIILALMVCINLYVSLFPKKKKEEDNQLVIQLNQLIKERLEGNKEATESVRGQVESFTKGMADLRNTVQQVQESVKSVVSFQDIFKSPKLRGMWGEESLESSLNQYFGKDQYETQHYFKSGEVVDAILELPNNLILPIDSKFNWENFEKMVKADNAMNRDIYKKQFLSDVKKKVDEIASKYIIPSENTTDMALMYIPAEAVYYELINNIEDVDIPKYARLKKVILVSPNTFYLTVTAIHQWFRSVEVSKQTKDIIKRLERVTIDANKLTDDFRILGKHIANAHGAYDSTEKRLDLMKVRIDNVIEIGASEPDKLVAKPTNIKSPTLEPSKTDEE